jgi:hypothetical protein
VAACAARAAAVSGSPNPTSTGPGPAEAAPQPTAPRRPTDIGGGGRGNGNGSAGAAAPSAQPNSGGPFLHNDYSVKATSDCHWIMDGAMHLSLHTEFTIDYQALMPVVQGPWTLTNDRNSLLRQNSQPSKLPVTFTESPTDT